MIRLLTPSDIPWIVRQEELIFGHSLGEQHYQTLHELGNLLGYLKEDGSLQGALICSRNDEHVQIENLFVLEDYRRRGVATNLLSRLIQDMTTYHVRYISLEVRVDLLNVISLYQSMEFKTVKQISNYYPDHTDAVYMVYERSDR